MRIVIANRYGSASGGIESYLAWLVPELVRAGHEVAILCELDDIPERTSLIAQSAERWCTGKLGVRRALAQMLEWQPDVILVNGEMDEALEAGMLAVAPAVYFAHGFSGACITGSRVHMFPAPIPCKYTFGPGCLLRYYPRRCGGLSPLTMLSLYRKNSRHRDQLKCYRAIVTGSDFVRNIYLDAGLPASTLSTLLFELPEFSGPLHSMARRAPGADRPLRLLFSGRLTAIKGGRVLIEAAALAAAALARPLQLTFAGDGPERKRWQRAASKVARRNSGMTFLFPGWLTGEELQRLYSESDLLVVPSLWPEPFGLVGPEAGLHGVPQAAFAVGGIREWLIDGQNGYLAPANPPTAKGLAQAIVKCLVDPMQYERLSLGAIAIARRFTKNRHADRFIGLLGSIATADQGNVGPLESVATPIESFT